MKIRLKKAPDYVTITLFVKGGRMEFAEIAELEQSKPDKEQTGMVDSGRTSSLSLLRKYIIERISHFFPYINDTKCHVHFLFPEKFKSEKNEDFVTKVLKVHHPLQQKYASAGLTAAMVAGKNTGKVISVWGEDDKKHIVAVLGCSDAPMLSLYYNVCTMFQVMQQKYLYPEYFENIERQMWLWRDKGIAEERISAMLKATNFNYEKVRKITAFYSDVQAFSGAGAYLMIKAVQSGRADLIDRLEKFVLLQAAALSENLLNIQHCVLNCAYPAVKNLIGQIKNHGAAAYLDPQGWVDWKKLYDYTLSEAKNIGYSPHAIMDVRQNEGKFLQIMAKQYPERQQMLNILPWCPEYKNSKILQDFAEAQKFYLNNR